MNMTDNNDNSDDKPKDQKLLGHQLTDEELEHQKILEYFQRLSDPYSPIDETLPIDQKIEKLFRDLGDNFQFDRSMIHFNSTANTQIPNDQKSFAEFCYGDMMECKTVGDIDTCVKNIPP